MYLSKKKCLSFYLKAARMKKKVKDSHFDDYQISNKC